MDAKRVLSDHHHLVDGSVRARSPLTLAEEAGQRRSASLAPLPLTLGKKAPYCSTDCNRLGDRSVCIVTLSNTVV